MRPLLWDVDHESIPPRMTICFPDRPNRYIAVRIRSEVKTHQEASVAAVRELDGFTPLELQLLAESARPMEVASIPIVPTMTIEQVEQENRTSSMVHCPLCCHQLGRGDSPSLGYLDRCSSCKRRLTVRFAPGMLTVVVWTDR